MQIEIDLPSTDQIAVSEINAPYRRLDSLAYMLQGTDKAAAIYFDGTSIKMASNVQEQSELARKVFAHIRLLARADCTEPGFINSFSISRNNLIKYVNTISSSMSQEWYQDFINNLERIENSIYAVKIEGNEQLKNYFPNIVDPKTIAFSPEMLTALQQDITFIVGQEGVHAELKLTQDILDHPSDANKQSYIGVSKKCCINCQSAIMAVNQRSAEFNTLRDLFDSSATIMPGAKFRIVTRDILTGTAGSGLSFACAVPNFLLNDESLAEAFLRERNKTISGRTSENISAAFRQNSLPPSDEVTKMMRRTRSPSPTGRESAVLGYNAILRERKRQNDLNKEFATVAIGPAIEEREKSSYASSAASASAKPGNIAASAKSNSKHKADKNKQKVEIDEDDQFLNEVIAQKLLTQQSQPIIIFYERYRDVITVQVVNDLLGEMKEHNIMNLLIHDDGLKQTKVSPLTYYQAEFMKASRMKSRVDEIAFLTVDAQYRMLSGADRLGIQVHNSSNAIANEVIAISAESTSITRSYNQRLQTLYNVGKSMEESHHDQIIMDIFAVDNNSEYRAKLGKQIADKIFSECSNNSGVTAILDLEDAKAVEKHLKELGCNNVVSIFMYKNVESAMIYMGERMWLYNQDYAQAQMIPNSIVINATDTRAVSEVSDLVKPYIPRPLLHEAEGQAASSVSAVAKANGKKNGKGR